MLEEIKALMQAAKLETGYRAVKMKKTGAIRVYIECPVTQPIINKLFHTFDCILTVSEYNEIIITQLV